MKDGNHEGFQANATIAIEEQKTIHVAEGPVTSILVSTEVEVGSKFKSTAEASAKEESVAATVGHISEGKPLVLLQVNCRSIFNKVLEFWNYIDTYNSDVAIGTESWLSEEINSAETFRDDYITIRRDMCSQGGGVFICVKITSIAG